jgi:beta-N-acetylhexosaminidase
MRRYCVKGFLLIGGAVFVAITYLLIKPLFISKSNPSPTPTLSPETLQDLRISRFVQETLKNMTIENKVGQMFMWGINEASLSAQTEKLIRETHAGGIILMGKHTPDQFKRLTASLKNIDSPIPLFIAVDGEISMMDRYGVDFQTVGKAADQLTNDEFCELISKNTTYLKTLGINLNFGIVADIGYFDDSFIKGRTYGKTAETVTAKVKSALACSHELFTTVKHFPGHGNTVSDSHTGIPVISLSPEEWQKTDALPFLEAINGNADFIMFGHLLYPNIASTPASLSKQFHTMIRMFGFHGITITDDLGMLEGPKYTPMQLITQALDADNDILLYINCSEPKAVMFSHAVQRVINQDIPIKRIDQSVERILRTKYRLLKDVEQDINL